MSHTEPMSHDGLPEGLAVSSGGYTFVPSVSSLTPGVSEPFTFTVTGPHGHPVTSYALMHEKELHLIVVRRDLSFYQHLHPARSAGGEWSIPLTVPFAGVYKAFASFQPTEEPMAVPMTLAVDLMASGDFQPEPLPAPAASSSVDGFGVDLDGQPSVGGSELTFTVTRSGTPVTDLQPYLGAYGHLVALRVGDLAYVHVHPEQTANDGDVTSGRISFHVPLPTASHYRLFLDFKVDKVVHTAEFTIVASRPVHHRPH